MSYKNTAILLITLLAPLHSLQVKAEQTGSNHSEKTSVNTEFKERKSITFIFFPPQGKETEFKSYFEILASKINANDKEKGVKPIIIVPDKLGDPVIHILHTENSQRFSKMKEVTENPEMLSSFVDRHSSLFGYELKKEFFSNLIIYTGNFVGAR